jgi:hyperosmotically inducible protein
MTYRPLVALVATLALGACSKSQVDGTQNALASAVPESVKSAIPMLEADAKIVARIEGHFVEIDPSSAVHVLVSAKSGAVALSGSVRSADVRKRFVAAANGVRDVKSVASTIAVDPTLPNASEDARDFTLEARVRAKLVEEAGLGGVKIGVTARNGAVTLSGSVETAAIRTTLVQAAEGVKGATHVANQLTVK